MVSALVTSFRMYGACPAVAGAWRALFARVFADVGVDIRFIEHGFPQPIDELWSMPELCCDFMCGWPFVRSNRRMREVAVPVPALARYAGLPRYCSEFLVGEQSGFTSIEDTFGHRVGWMETNSQSGFNAPRAFLATFLTPERRTLFRESRGPYFTPGRLLDSLQRHEIDVVALDSFYLDLCRAYAPARLASLRSIAQTPWAPLPLLVAGPEVSPAMVDELRAYLLGIREKSAYAPLLANVLLEGFAAPDLELYCQLESMAQFAIDRGYPLIR